SSVPQSIRGNILQQQVLGLEFLGGCFLPVLFYAPWLWSAKTLLKGLAVAVPCALLPFLVETHKRLLWEANGHLNWPMFLQSALFIAAGLHVLLLIAAIFLDRRDATSLLLVLRVL